LFDPEIFPEAYELTVLNAGDPDDAFAEISDCALIDDVCGDGVLGFDEVAWEIELADGLVMEALDFAPDTELEASEISRTHQNTGVFREAIIVDEGEPGRKIGFAGGAGAHEDNNLIFGDLLKA
jgi:hypothetical protein